MYYSKCNYNGERINGRLEGRGKFTFANGNYYIGHFMDGEFHGEGTIYFTPENGGGTYRAVWDHGVALEGTYFFHDGLQFEKEDWDYCTTQDRRFWRECNAFIVPPFAGSTEGSIVPDYSDGRVLEIRPPLDDWTVKEEEEVSDGRSVPHHLAFLKFPATIESGHPFLITVEIQDLFGDCVIRASTAIELELLDGEGELICNGPTEATKGRVEFQCRYKGEGLCSFRVKAKGLPSLDSEYVEAMATTVYDDDLRPICLQLEGVPKEVVQGQEFSVTVQIIDLNMNEPLALDAGTMQVLMKLASGSGSLGGTVRIWNEGSTVLYYDLVYYGDGPFTLTCLPATADTHVTESDPIQVIIPNAPVEATHVTVVSVAPYDPIRGTPIQVQVVLQDSECHPATRADDIPVSLKLGIGDGQLVGAGPSLTSGGFAAFAHVQYNAMDPFTLIASAPGLRDSDPTKIIMYRPAQEAIEVAAIYPLVQPPGEPFTVHVLIMDDAGMPVPDPDQMVTLSLASGEGALSGTTTARSVESIGGCYVFPDVRFNGQGPFTLVATTATLSSPESIVAFSGTLDNEQVSDLYPPGQPAQLHITGVAPTTPVPGGDCKVQVQVLDAFGDLCPEGAPLISVYLLPDSLTIPSIEVGSAMAVDSKATITIPNTGDVPFQVWVITEGLMSAFSGLLGYDRQAAEDDVPVQLHIAHLSQPIKPGEPFQVVAEVQNKKGRLVSTADCVVRLKSIGVSVLTGLTHAPARHGVAVFNNCVYPDTVDVVQGSVQAMAHGLQPSVPVALLGGHLLESMAEEMPEKGEVMIFGYLPARPCTAGREFLLDVRILNAHTSLCQADNSTAVTVSLVPGTDGTLSGDCTAVASGGIARFVLQFAGNRAFRLVAVAEGLPPCTMDKPLLVMDCIDGDEGCWEHVEVQELDAISPEGEMDVGDVFDAPQGSEEVET